MYVVVQNVKCEKVFYGGKYCIFFSPNIDRIFVVLSVCVYLVLFTVCFVCVYQTIYRRTIFCALNDFALLFCSVYIVYIWHLYEVNCYSVNEFTYSTSRTITID